MQFAIAIATDADSWRVVRRAEELGFARAWFYDTQMLSADPFVAMAAAALKTTEIRLGTGVLIPSNRIAPSPRRAAGRGDEPFDAVVLTRGAILKEGEPADSPRAIAQAGPRAGCYCTARPTRHW
jgi:hypothetical protein